VAGWIVDFVQPRFHVGGRTVEIRSIYDDGDPAMVSTGWKRIVLAAMLAGGLGGCGANSIDLPPPPTENPVYRLAPGDKVSVQVFAQPELSGQFDVNADGNVSLPLIGSVPARNRSVAEMTEDLRGRLDRFVVNPRFTFDVVTYRPIFVLGQVSRPGSFPFAAGMTVQQAIALAGGYTRRAVTEKVMVTRLTDNGPKDYSIGPQDILVPGDTLDVQRRLF
jgi:polysaccharide export outer membrane protein